jgi:hypothetical protein
VIDTPGALARELEHVPRGHLLDQQSHIDEIEIGP